MHCHHELIAIKLTVSVAVAAILRSKGARWFYDFCVLSGQLRLIPLILTRSNYHDQLFTGGHLSGLGHLHQFK